MPDYQDMARTIQEVVEDSGSWVSYDVAYAIAEAVTQGSIGDDIAALRAEHSGANNRARQQ
jgi:hypothetical protein